MEIVKKRRGRKPKDLTSAAASSSSSAFIPPTPLTTTLTSPPIKEKEVSVIPKKKRGRKKKCIIDIESGYHPFNNECTITTPTGIQFSSSQTTTTSVVSNKSKKNENEEQQKNEQNEEEEEGSDDSRVEIISFGPLKIKRRKCKLVDPSPILQRIRESGLCQIDLTKIRDPNNENNNNTPVVVENQQRFTASVLSYVKKKPTEDQRLTTLPDLPKIRHVQNETTPSNRLKEQRRTTSSTPLTNYTSDVLSCYNGMDGVYPQTTKIWCWWCCHPFKERPCFIPTQYDELRNRYRIQGNFCSWHCAKAFLLFDEGKFVNTLSLHLFTSMVKKLTGTVRGLNSAPPRQSLECFGGNMSIEQFRTTSRSPDNEFVLQTQRFILDNNFKVVPRK